MTVVSMSQFFQNCKFRSPEQAFEDALAECKERGIKKVLVLMLHDEASTKDGSDYTFHAAGVSRKDSVYLAHRYLQDT